MTEIAGRSALVLAGGGARAAYQVGVLQAIREVLPDPRTNPFPIITGTSAGAVNAGALACVADDFSQGVENLLDVWRNFEPGHVYRSDFPGATANSARWLAGLFFGAFLRDRRVSLLDNRPLAALLERRLDFDRIAPNIAGGHLDAVAITCSGYSSGQSVSFFEGRPGLTPWKRSQRVGLATRIGLDHLLASSAIPFVFPPRKVHREFFGDGSMRQIAPVSPALHLGADRVVIVGTARIRNDEPGRVASDGYPPLAQVAGHVMNSIFLDSLAVDVERLERINRTVAAIPPERRREAGIALHHVDVLVLAPSEPLESIAARHVGSLPATIRFLLRSVGTMRRGGANFASYLLFEKGYCRELIDLGYRDTMARREEVEAFLGGALCPMPGAYDVEGGGTTSPPGEP